MAITRITKEAQFLNIPEDASQELKDYLRRLEELIADVYRSSELLDTLLEDGKIGN